MNAWSRSATRLYSDIARHFGEVVQYTPAGGATIDVTGEWHENPTQGEVEMEVTVSDQGHSLDLQLADLPGDPGEGDLVSSTARGNWVVWDAPKNGDGKVTLFLHKVG